MKKSKLDEFAHIYNPMHIYCRLRELDVSRQDAVDLAIYYERVFYEPLIETLEWKEKLK